jgi:transcriptional regulator with XRE-family HTH domain
MVSIDPNICSNRLLRDKREAYHWTIEEVSAKIGVDPRTYRRWEHGEQRPHLHSLKRLCTVFESSAEDLGYSIDESSQYHNESSE